jgi:hypothetical protein
MEGDKNIQAGDVLSLLAGYPVAIPRYCAVKFKESTMRQHGLLAKEIRDGMHSELRWPHNVFCEANNAHEFVVLYNFFERVLCRKMGLNNYCFSFFNEYPSEMLPSSLVLNVPFFQYLFQIAGKW